MSLNIQNCAPFVPTPLEKIKEKITKAGTWIWEHKKWVVLTVVTTAGVIFVVKKRTAIKELFQSLHIGELTAKSAVNAITEENVPAIPDDVLNHRKGKTLTATKLGDKVGVTIFYKGIMPSEKILDFPVDCNFLTGSVNL